MLYAILLCLFFSSLDAISLKLRTQNNSTTQPAQQAFRLVVEVSEGDRNTSNVVLDGMQQLQMIGQQRSNQIVMVNNSFSSTTTYLFTVIASTPGTITVGPAKVHHQGKEVASNTLTLTITNPSQASPTQATQSQGTLAPTLRVNKNEVVLGEPIEATFTFAVNRQVLEAAVGQFESTDFEIKEQQKQWTQRQEIINGTNHLVLEKKYLLTPHKEGVFDLGPLPFEAIVPAQRTRNNNGNVFDDDFFAGFFGPQQERLQMRSNGLRISVKPLPTDQHVDSVGLFTSYKASLSATQAHTHEPLTLTLDLEGTGNLEQITIPKLVLPKGIKYYESKNETVENTAGTSLAGKKHFEFVLQATKPGVFTIPSQAFTFFNTTSRRVSTLRTDELSIAIRGTTSSQAPEPATNTPPAATDAPSDDEQPVQAPLPDTPPTALPWWVFMAILCMPLPFYAKSIGLFCRRCVTYLQAKKQTTKAHYEKSFKALLKQQDLDGIYIFFMAYIAKQKNIPNASLSIDNVEEYLTQRGFEYEKIDDFISFLGNCSGAKYAHKSASAQEKDALLTKAQYWFLMLL